MYNDVCTVYNYDSDCTVALMSLNLHLYRLPEEVNQPMLPVRKVQVSVQWDHM